MRCITIFFYWASPIKSFCAVNWFSFFSLRVISRPTNTFLSVRLNGMRMKREKNHFNQNIKRINKPFNLSDLWFVLRFWRHLICELDCSIVCTYIHTEMDLTYKSSHHLAWRTDLENIKFKENKIKYNQKNNNNKTQHTPNKHRMTRIVCLTSWSKDFECFDQLRVPIFNCNNN